MTKKKHYALPKRFSVATTQKAYDRLRAINARTNLSNNYILTVLLERLDDFSDDRKLDAVFDEFIREYGAPKSASMEGKKDG